MMDELFRVVIADDELHIRRGLVEAIPWAQYHAEITGTAEDGDSALALLLTEKPDLAVLDIKMPGLDGLEVIRRAVEAGLPTRFLILSGYDDFALAQKAIRYGVRNYFLKPLKIDEFKDELSRQIREIQKDRMATRSDEEQKAMLAASQSFFLSQLSQGTLLRSDEIRRRTAMLNLDWLSGEYLVLAMSNTCADRAQQAALLQTAIPAVNGYFSACDHVTWIHNGEVLLTLFRTDTGASPLAKGLPGLVSGLSGQHGQRFFAALSKACRDAHAIPLASTQAIRALSYHIYCNEEDLYTDDMVCRREPDYGPEDIAADEMVHALEADNEEEITVLCTAFKDKLFFVPMPAPDYLRSMFFHLVTKVRIRFLSLHPEFTSLTLSDPAQMRTCHSVDGLLRWTVNCLLQLAAEFKGLPIKEDPLIRRAKGYIRENLSKNLKAKDVASHIGLSESYFTVYFKQKTGENFRDYCLEKRTEIAKKLLREKQLSIGEIAEATGYQDYRSFSRAFKNVTGLSPTEYQNS